MAKLTFVGGIHPYDGKDLSKDKPIKVILPQGEMVYPLSQHIGAPATAIVKKGGFRIACKNPFEADKFMGQSFPCPPYPNRIIFHNTGPFNIHPCNIASFTENTNNIRLGGNPI